MKILLLEDEYSLRVSIEEFLTDIGYSVDAFINGSDAYDAVYENHYDIYILDIKVPGINGFEFLKTLRSDGNKTPAIFMTAMTQIHDLEEGYKIGCCDYIRKPFDLAELQLRITQACKSFYFNNESELELANGLVFDTKLELLQYMSEEIILSKTEKSILSTLIKYQNQIVSLAMFQDEIWGEYVDPANIRVQINNLRKKLPQDVIKNRRGQGYIIG